MEAIVVDLAGRSRWFKECEAVVVGKLTSCAATCVRPERRSLEVVINQRSTLNAKKLEEASCDLVQNYDGWEVAYIVLSDYCPEQ